MERRLVSSATGSRIKFLSLQITRQPRMLCLRRQHSHGNARVVARIRILECSMAGRIRRHVNSMRYPGYIKSTWLDVNNKPVSAPKGASSGR